MTAPYDISIVVPTLADDSALVSLLSTIRRWPRQPREVIVADGASSPALGARWLVDADVEQSAIGSRFRNGRFARSACTLVRLGT
ncbi:MAG: hypothetical protein ACRETX_12690, partial [Steroidobacteraceae bacterium]